MIESTRSASMASMVGPSPRIGNYPKPDGIGLAARRLGTTRGTVKQWMYGRDSVFQRAAVILESLHECGQGTVAAGLKRPLDAAALPRTVRPLTDLFAEEQALDGREDEAQVAYLLTRGPAEKDTYRRILLKYRAKVDDVLHGLEAT